MKELLILLLIGAAGYLAYDDYYKQRPALQQAQTEIQQLRQNPVRLNVAAPGARRAWIPVTPTPPAWFQERLENGSTLDSSRKHKQKDSQQP